MTRNMEGAKAKKAASSLQTPPLTKMVQTKPTILRSPHPAWAQSQHWRDCRQTYVFRADNWPQMPLKIEQTVH